MGSKSGPTQTTTQQNTLSPQALQAQQALLANGLNILNPFLQTPAFATAGLSPDQIMASNLANAAAIGSSQNVNNPIKAYDVFGMGGPDSVKQAQAQQATAAQLKPGDIHPFLNPYIEDAINPTLDRLRQQQLEVQARIGADAAASRMFGGSREAVMRMLADRNYRDTVGTTAGNMLSAGFDKASGLASGNVDRQQAANLLNAQLGTQTAIANAGFGNTAAQNDAARFLQALGLQQQINTSAIGDQLKVAQMLAGLGGQQQATVQNAINAPFDALTKLLQITGALQGGGTSTSNTTTTSQMDLASILLGGLGILGKAGTGSILGSMLGFSSDRNDKTDIKKLGKDPATGVDMYAYRYKGDPKSYPKVVGPMAQDLEKVLPGITKMIGGHRVVTG